MNTAAELRAVSWHRRRALRMVACGAAHAAVVARDGTVGTVGANGAGQLGTGTFVSNVAAWQRVSFAPVRAIAVAAGNAHTAVVLADATLRTFGSNAHGQLGVGNTVSLNLPQDPGLSGVVGVACGGFHTLCLLNDGSVRAFGRGAEGQLGTGDAIDRAVAVTPAGLAAINAAKVVDIAAGARHSAVVKSDGSVWCAGLNDGYQAGNFASTANVATFARVVGVTDVASVACSANVTYALHGNGAVSAWGLPLHFRSPLEGTGNVRPLPQVVAAYGTSDAVAVYAGTANGAFGLSANGTSLVLGSNVATVADYSPALANASLSTRTITSRPFMPTVAVGGYFTLIGWSIDYASPQGPPDAGNNWPFVLAVTSDGCVAVRGYNQYGQLGLGSKNSSNFVISTTVPNVTTAVGVAAGPTFSAILLANGRMLTAGEIRIYSGGTTYLYDPDYLLPAWYARGGADRDRTTFVDSGLTDVVKIACGLTHGLALHANAKVTMWGYNSWNQITSNVTSNVWLSSARDIAAGMNASAIITTGGFPYYAGYAGGYYIPYQNNSYADWSLRTSGLPAGVNAVALEMGYVAWNVLLENGSVYSMGISFGFGDPGSTLSTGTWAYTGSRFDPNSLVSIHATWNGIVGMHSNGTAIFGGGAFSSPTNSLRPFVLQPNSQGGNVMFGANVFVTDRWSRLGVSVLANGYMQFHTFANTAVGSTSWAGWDRQNAAPISYGTIMNDFNFGRQIKQPFFSTGNVSGVASLVGAPSGGAAAPAVLLASNGAQTFYGLGVANTVQIVV